MVFPWRYPLVSVALESTYGSGYCTLLNGCIRWELTLQRISSPESPIYRRLGEGFLHLKQFSPLSLQVFENFYFQAVARLRFLGFAFFILSSARVVEIIRSRSHLILKQTSRNPSAPLWGRNLPKESIFKNVIQLPIFSVISFLSSSYFNILIYLQFPPNIFPTGEKTQILANTSLQYLRGPRHWLKKSKDLSWLVWIFFPCSINFRGPSLAHTLSHLK